MTTFDKAELSRRHFIAGVGVTVAGAGVIVPMTVSAQATPAASPAALDSALVQRVSQNLVGGASLAEDAIPALATLLAAEPGIAASLAELDGIAEMTPEALAATSAEAKAVATNILTYWYQGLYDGAPVANRAEMFFQFASWQALPYMTQPTLCKAFGYWATDVMPS